MAWLQSIATPMSEHTRANIRSSTPLHPTDLQALKSETKHINVEARNAAMRSLAETVKAKQGKRAFVSGLEEPE